MINIKDKFVNYIHSLQDKVTGSLEEVDGKSLFFEDRWERPGGGGGKTRVISNGNIFEKGGVNTSVVYGTLSETMQKHFDVEESEFFACGISLIMHPENPMVPTVHANFRYFQLFNAEGELKDQWLGGGVDMTPYYFWQEDAIHFHQVFKKVCDVHDLKFYDKYSKECDKYFYNHHRDEPRGIGGLFFDYLRPDKDGDLSFWYQFVTDVGDVFLDAYMPIVIKRKDEPYNDKQKYWQEIRRGRYVEFNLIHDHGTLFGLKTNGRIESILMSLPPTVRWDYDYTPEPGSREAELIEAIKNNQWLKF